MILTLSARCLRSMLLAPARGKRPALDMLDLPKFTRETLGLSGVNLSTDLLVGADRARLEGFRERADRAGCACLLLAEFEPQNIGADDEATVQAAATRIRKVIEAAQILGCSAASIKIQAPDNDPTLTQVAAVMKPLVERAEKLDLNVLISPHAGLTSTPERVTELLKKVGGFRIGTHPDFEVAASSKDPVGYLHRLTPYATAVTATTIKLLDEPAPPPPKPKKPAKSAAAATAAAGAGEEKASGKGRKGKAKPEPEPEPEPDPELDEDVDDIEALIDEAIAEGEEEGPPPLEALRHEPYDLGAMISAIMAVGYDGPLALDYRGTGNLTTSLVQSRDTFLALIMQARAAM